MMRKDDREVLIRIDERVFKMHKWQQDQEGRIRGLEKARGIGVGILLAFGAAKAWVLTQMFGTQ